MKTARVKITKPVAVACAHVLKVWVEETRPGYPPSYRPAYVRCTLTHATRVRTRNNTAHRSASPAVWWR